LKALFKRGNSAKALFYRGKVILKDLVAGIIKQILSILKINL